MCQAEDFILYVFWRIPLRNWLHDMIVDEVRDFRFALDPGTLRYQDLFVECSAFGDFESVHCENFITFSVHF